MGLKTSPMMRQRVGHIVGPEAGPIMGRRTGHTRKRSGRQMEQVLMGMVVCLSFLTGSCIFSFLNVVVYRVPKKISFLTGRSMCPACGHPLTFFDMIPVAGWFLLRGKCRYCGAGVSFRYPLVEALGGGAALLCLRDGFTIQAALEFGFFCILTVTALVDLDTMEIPNGFVMGAALLGLLAIILDGGSATLFERLVGMVCVSLPMLALAMIIPGAFGGGDIKLMAACGLFLGWKVTLLSFFFAVLGGGAYGIWLLLTKKKKGGDHFAFGPFLCVGMLVGRVWGMSILAWYLGLFGLQPLV
ncbi:MAG: prepilin peptidase [Eubacteriales bacterium]|nr:prepilin peptidase [Eubacteriales bacterium]